MQLVEPQTDDPQRWEEAIASLLAEADRAPEPAAKVECLREAALIYERQLDDLPRALVSWQGAFAADPTNDEVAAALERVAEELGCWHTVLPELEELLGTTTETVPRAAMLTRLADWQERMVGGETAAEQLLCEAAALLPASVRVAQARSALYRGRGEWAQAVDVLVHAAAAVETPDQVAFLLEAARMVHGRLGDSERAIRLYRQVLSVQPANPVATEALAELGSEGQNVVLLCEQYRRAHQDAPDDLTVIREWADLAFAHQRWADVRLLFDYLYARAGGVTAPVRPDGRTLLNEQLERFVANRQWPEAINTLHALADDSTPSERAKYYVTAGKIAHHELKDDTAAVELFGLALEAQPDDFPTLDRLYGILSARQAWGQAESMVRRLIDQLRAAGRSEEPAVMVPLWRRLGEIYRLGMRNMTGAAEAYRECARLAPDDRFVRLVADLIDRHPAPKPPKAKPSDGPRLPGMVDPPDPGR
jgi:tetratricopeptide (TPR) repeat protein